MTQPSLVTQKVQAAFWKDIQHIENVDEFNLAAAIRELADQLINVNWSVEMWELHRDFHVIAAELEVL